MDPIITVYAEFLHNIRQLTISITLISNCNKSTTVELSQDRKALVIEHQAQQIIAQLPAQVDADAILPRPLPRTKELVFRLNAAEDRDSWQPKRLELDDHAIWPASSLTPDTRISCRACQSVVLRGSVKVWKDLPSDNWAEMMDFWHCHKPDNEDCPRQDASQSTKGYAAFNSLAPLPGCGLVHLDHFRIHESDCRGLQRSSTNDQIITCAECDEEVGTKQDDSDLIRLFKWNVFVRRARNTYWESCTFQKFVCARLLALIANQGTRKFIAYSGELGTAKEVLRLWVLNPTLIYSSTLSHPSLSSSSTKIPKPAMKILYRITTSPDPNTQPPSSTTTTTTWEDLPLSETMLHALRNDLVSSGKLLPLSARRFQEWEVGLLGR